MIIFRKIFSSEVICRDNSAPIDVTANQNQAIRRPKHLIEKKGIGLLILDLDECEYQSYQSHCQESINAQTLVRQPKIDDIF